MRVYTHTFQRMDFRKILGCVCLYLRIFVSMSPVIQITRMKKLVGPASLLPWCFSKLWRWFVLESNQSLEVKRLNPTPDDNSFSSETGKQSIKYHAVVREYASRSSQPWRLRGRGDKGEAKGDSTLTISDRRKFFLKIFKDHGRKDFKTGAYKRLALAFAWSCECYRLCWPFRSHQIHSSDSLNYGFRWVSNYSTHHGFPNSFIRVNYSLGAW